MTQHQNFGHKTLLLPRLFLASFLVASLASCNMQKQLSDMHDKTDDLDAQTHELNDETKAVGATSKDIDNKTDVLIKTGGDISARTTTLLDDSKHGSTLDLRTKLWPEIQEKQEVAPRLTTAAKYMMSQEYQLWSDEGMDTLASRDILGGNAVQEFLGDTQKLFKSTKILISPLSEDGKEAALNALTATMDQIDRIQKAMLTAHPDIKPMTLLTLIEDSLADEKAIDSGAKSLKDFPEYVNYVLQDKDVAIYLLKVRYNYLMFVGIGSLVKDELTPKSQKESYVMKAKQIVLEKYCGLAARGPHIKADLASYDTQQIQRMNMFLQLAVETRDFLKSINVTPEVHCTLKTLMS